MKKRGNIIVTYELLEEVLKLPKGVEIIGIESTESDKQRETITLRLASIDDTQYTRNVGEGNHIPYELFDICSSITPSKGENIGE